MKIEIKVGLLSDMDYTGVRLDRFYCIIIVLMSIYNYQLCLNKVCYNVRNNNHCGFKRILLHKEHPGFSLFMYMYLFFPLLSMSELYILEFCYHRPNILTSSSSLHGRENSQFPEYNLSYA